MERKNSIARMKELGRIIREADVAYFQEDAPQMTDREYDDLVEELKALEEATGIVFANSPTKKVGGGARARVGVAREGGAVRRGVERSGRGVRDAERDRADSGRRRTDGMCSFGCA